MCANTIVLGLTVKCVECEKPRIIHSKNKLKQTEVDHLKRALSGQQDMCGGVFGEFVREKHAGILSIVFVRENLSCVVAIDFTYFSAAIYPDVCAYIVVQNIYPDVCAYIVVQNIP